MTDASDHAGKFWLELREPGKSPQRKGPFRVGDTAATLREFFAVRPDAFITVVTVSGDGVDFQDAPEALEMLDGRSSSVAQRHRSTSKEAHARAALAEANRALDEMRERAEADAARVAVLEEALEPFADYFNKVGRGLHMEDWKRAARAAAGGRT